MQTLKNSRNFENTKGYPKFSFRPKVSDNPLIFIVDDPKFFKKRLLASCIQHVIGDAYLGRSLFDSTHNEFQANSLSCRAKKLKRLELFFSYFKTLQIAFSKIL